MRNFKKNPYLILPSSVYIEKIVGHLNINQGDIFKSVKMIGLRSGRINTACGYGLMKNIFITGKVQVFLQILNKNHVSKQNIKTINTKGIV